MNAFLLDNTRRVTRHFPAAETGGKDNAFSQEIKLNLRHETWKKIARNNSNYFPVVGIRGIADPNALGITRISISSE